MNRSTTASEVATVRRAILSVSDKTGLAEFAQGLAELGIELFSTGGTARHLTEHDLDVCDISEYTGFPEIMDGRVKTLHPRIFGGILCRRDHPEDLQATTDHDILPFDLVVVNLYPFAETIARSDCDHAMAIENIDIGGPSLVRAAAKNCRFVTVATDPDQYQAVLAELKAHGGTTADLRTRLMADAFRHTAEYDQAIADYFSRQTEEAPTPTLPKSIDLRLRQATKLRYGENSHQSAALYEIEGHPGVCLSKARQLHGKELSFNNLLDLNAGLTMVSSFDQPTCVVIKHNNPCGAATGDDLADVFRRAFAGDPVSAFGSIVATNQTIDAETAEFLATGNFFVEAILSPKLDAEAVEILTTRPKWKKNVRLIESPLVPGNQPRLDLRYVHGGMLVQQADDLSIQTDGWKTVGDRLLSDDLMKELIFAWNMVRFVKSNAIVLGKSLALCGVGAGQMSRVDAVRIAIEKAGDKAEGSVLASDAFFPFPDSIDLAARHGIAAVIQPGGSVKDDAVIQACQKHGIPMVLTGRRHFLH